MEPSSDNEVARYRCHCDMRYYRNTKH